MKHAILCVDDEVDNVDALERVFRKKFEVLKATSGKEALEILKNKTVSLIISDQRMPQMTGIEFLKKAISLQPDAVRILLTGFTDIDSVIAAINTGQVYQYVTKPWDPRDLMITIERGIERFEMGEELKRKNKELSEALSELKILDQAKSHFMILINHELKTPLTAAISFSELLAETKLDSEQKKYTDRINKSLDRLKEIVFDVLELTSAELGTMPLDAKKTTLEALLKDVPAEFQAEATDKKQSFELKIEKISVFADRKIIYSVLKRIVHNAVKFGDKGSVIRVEGAATDDSNIQISVASHGEVLSADTIKHIMKPFALNENVMNHSKGLGLGLSLCQALLKHHGSRLQIESSSKLTRVSFELKKA